MEPQNAALILEGAIHSWVTGVLFEEHDSKFIVIGNSYRNLFRGNTFRNLFRPLVDATNHSAIVLGQTSDNVVENNAFLEQVPRGITVQQTATRNVIAYNFFDDPGNLTVPATEVDANGDTVTGQTGSLCRDLRPAGGGRSIFHHGGYAHSTLAEGNDALCRMEIDIYWGKMGPYITYYRNRLRSGDEVHPGLGMLGTEEFGGIGGQQAYINYIGNTVQYMYTNYGQFAVDRGDEATHAEFNVIRVECKIQQTGGNVDPQCADSLISAFFGPPPVPAIPTVWTNNNVGALALPAWSALDVPDSLVYDQAPSWWCQESCPFDGNTGIGAFGDDFTNGEASLCTLPAERFAKGLTCTPLP